MKRRYNHWLAPALAALSLLWENGAQAQALPRSRNAAWLPDYTVLKNVPDMLAHMQRYGVRYLLPIDGALTANGAYGGSKGMAASYMNDIHDYEARTGYKFTVLLFMVGELDKGKKTFVDISNPALRATIAGECAKFTSKTVSGSFVADAQRTFDGVVLDLEPGGVYRSSAPFVEMGKAARSAMGKGKIVAFYTPQFHKTPSDWFWDDDAYYDLAASGSADFLMAATYGAPTPEYQTAIQTQVAEILRAVSGAAWGDALHPAPKTGIQVFFGFPAYGKKNHAIPEAAKGTIAALSQLDPISIRYFAGAHVFRQTNGDTSDDTAQYATDWVEFQRDWLTFMPSTNK